MADDDLNRWGTQQAVADAAGITQQAVSNWIKKGIVKAGKNGKYHIGKSVMAIEAARDPDRALVGMEGAAVTSKNGASEIPLGPAQLIKARTVSATLAAQEQQIKLKRLQGELIERADVEAAIRSAQTIVIERLEGLPGQLAARVMQAPSVPAAEAIIRDAVRAVRDELAKLGQGIANG